jgi:hypothetical protein
MLTYIIIIIIIVTSSCKSVANECSLFKLYYSCHMQLLWNLLTKSNMVDQNHIYNAYNHLYKGPSWN